MFISHSLIPWRERPTWNREFYNVFRNVNSVGVNLIGCETGSIPLQSWILSAWIEEFNRHFFSVLYCSVVFSYCLSYWGKASWRWLTSETSVRYCNWRHSILSVCWAVLVTAQCSTSATDIVKTRAVQGRPCRTEVRKSIYNDTDRSEQLPSSLVNNRFCLLP